MAETIEAKQIPQVTLFRTNAKVTRNNAMGERGFLFLGGGWLYTIEGTGGYVRLPVGRFECTMEKHPTRGQVFRVKAGGENGHNVKTRDDTLAGILIHAANYPDELQGCLAVGRTLFGNGIDKSRDAMGDVFAFCGGFGIGKKMMLEISSNNISNSI